LHLDSVFWFGWLVLGVLPTDTEGKLGKDFSVLCLWREGTHNDSNTTAILNSHTDKLKKCAFALRTMTHDDLFKRGWASCSANMIPNKTPPKKRLSMNQFFCSPCRLHTQQPSL
jgi:hypothetical protein